MLTNKKRVVSCLNLFLTVFGIVFVAGCTRPGPRALLEGKKLIEERKFAPAVEHLKAAIKLIGTNALAWNYLGLAYHGAGQATNAMLAYQKALALNHNLVEVHYNLGCLLLDQNKPDAAKSELTTYTLRQPNSPDGWLKLGAAQLRNRELGAAEKSFNAALKLSAQNPEALNDMGVIELHKSQPREAAQNFSAALKHSPDYRPALLNLAVVSHQYLNARPFALQKYREYLELKPRPANWEAVNVTANVLEQQLTPAKPSLTTNPVSPAGPATNLIPKPADTPPRVASTNLPKTEPAMNPLPVATPPKTNPPFVIANNTSPPKLTETPVKVEVVRVQDGPVVKPAQDVVAAPPPAARPAPEPVTTTKPATAPATETKVEKRGFLQRISPANLFRRETKTTPIVTPLNSTAGSPPPGPVEVAATTSKPEMLPAGAATEPSSASPPVFNRYVYRSPVKPAAGNRSEADVSFAQGVQAQRDHRPAAAVTAYRAATKADPGFFEAQYNLGLAAFEAGELPQSLLAYEQALAVTPDSANARYNFALALKEANYPLDAVQELEKLLTAHPEEARAHLSLANLYAQQLNQPSLARPHYLKVLAIDPRHPQATAIRYWLAANPQ
jgi:tetratricopeptide (TPR) repeat protein